MRFCSSAPGCLLLSIRWIASAIACTAPRGISPPRNWLMAVRIASTESSALGGSGGGPDGPSAAAETLTSGGGVAGAPRGERASPPPARRLSLIHI